MKATILRVLVVTGCLALAGVAGVAGYYTGFREGAGKSRNQLRGYTILTPEAIKVRSQDKDKSDLEFGEFETLLDVTYGTDAKHNRLNLFVPRNAPSPMPIVMWIHGAGNSLVSKGEKPESWTIALLKSGIAVADIDYRPFYVTTSPDNSGGSPFPSQIDDCKAAIRFLRANAAKYKLDPGAIGVMGSSFGGYLSALVGTSGEKVSFGPATSDPDVSSAVKAACSISGMTDMRAYVEQADSHRYAMGLDWPGGDNTGRFYVGPMNASQKEQSSPVFHVSPKTPPFLLIQGFDDASVPPYQADLLFVRLRNAKVDAELLLIPGAAHGGPPLETPITRKQVGDFFRKHLKSEQ